MSKAFQVLALMEQDLPSAIIVDIDGVVSPIEPRQDALDKEDWDAFHTQGCELEPSPWALEILKKFSPDHRIIFISGRPNEYREQTETWIREKLGLTDFDLYLNDSGIIGNYTEVPDYEFKVKVYQEQVAPKYRVVFVLDDRPRVVDALRDIGLLVLQPNFIDH